MIRDAQIAYQSVNGNYSSDWDSLLSLVENGEIYLIQIREATKLLDYGAEETTLYLDTLGSVSVIDSIFSGYSNFSAENLIADVVLKALDNHAKKMSDYVCLLYTSYTADE